MEIAGEIAGAIGPGLLVYVGAGRGDVEEDADRLARKVAGLRVFEDEEGRMNLDLAEIGGSLLAVSQFTLFGDCRKGKRPSFVDALEPDAAERLVERFCAVVRAEGIPVSTGRFRRHMRVHLVNDGPVTLLVDSRKVF